MIDFQVSLDFDPVKEKLKIRCRVYILMKKVMILRKIKVVMKTVTPPLPNHFSLSLNRKKMYVSENHARETKHIHASADNLLHTRKATGFKSLRMHGWVFNKVISKCQMEFLNKPCIKRSKTEK